MAIRLDKLNRNNLDEIYTNRIVAAHQNEVMFFENEFGWLLVPEDIHDEILTELKSYSSLPKVHEIEKILKIKFNSPDNIFYLHREIINIPRSSIKLETRILSKEDQRLFEQFESETSKVDLDNAYVELDHTIVVGSFQNGKLVGVASAYEWQEKSIQYDIGVVTNSKYQGKGVGYDLVKMLSNEILRQGFIPQYRCQQDNTASLKLAEKLGFELLGNLYIEIKK